MSDTDLSVIVPVYNNASTLGELIDRLLAVLESIGRPFELIFVDDGSSDGSLALLRQRAAGEPRIRPFALVKNFGSQAAACAGLDQVRGRVVVSLDADLENCPEDIPALLAPLSDGCDLVCGYRENRRAPFLTRLLPSALMNAFIRWRTGTTVPDLGCGMRVVDAALIRDLASEGEARRLLTPLILKRARKVAAVPVRQGITPRSSGHSFLSLLGLAADYYLATAGRPFLVTGLIAAGVIASGIVVFVVGSALTGLVLMAIGVFGALLSLIGEFSQRTYQLVQGRPFYSLRDLEREEATRSTPGPPDQR
ncbi:MAG: glycosyltransferase family 2 protein [Candidatus Binatia bacterium]